MRCQETYPIDLTESRHQSDRQLDRGALPAGPWHGGGTAEGAGGLENNLRAGVSPGGARRKGNSRALEEFE